MMGEARLYEVSKFFFTESEPSVPNCGVITYKLLNDITGEELP